jgi:hypothetical protein
MKTLGMILIAVGLIMTIFTGFDIVTEKKVVDVGPLEINKEEKTPVYWNPVLGIIILAAGVIVTITAKKN